MGFYLFCFFQDKLHPRKCRGGRVGLKYNLRYLCWALIPRWSGQRWAHEFFDMGTYFCNKRPLAGKKFVSKQPYRWWKKSCTTWHVWNPAINGIFAISTGAGFLPSTVAPDTSSLTLKFFPHNFWTQTFWSPLDEEKQLHALSIYANNNNVSVNKTTHTFKLCFLFLGFMCARV